MKLLGFVGVICWTANFIAQSFGNIESCANASYGESCEREDGKKGFCVNKECMLAFQPTSQPLLLMIRYPLTNPLARNAFASSSKLYVRGNGFGLNWSKGILLHEAEIQDTWKLRIDYAIAGDHEVKTLGRLEFRVYLNDSHDMLGANFALDLPLSSSVTNASKIQEYWVYPWFFSKKGSVKKRSIFSPELNEKRDFTVSLPASYEENHYKHYETMIVNDGQRLEMMLPQLETLMVSRALVREILVVGITNNYTERTPLLAVSNGSDMHCKNNGTPPSCNNCASCRSPPCSYEDYVDDYRRCYKWLKMPQVNGQSYLDFIQDQIIPTLKSEYRSMEGSESVGIMGFSMGGLMSCHAAWTRPQTFGSAACMSSSFWWPMPVNGTFPDDVGFEFTRTTLMQQREGRPRQKIYIDVGDQEGYIMTSPAKNATRILESTPYFELNENLWFYSWKGEYHMFHQSVHRMWIPLIALYGTEGSPKAEIIDKIVKEHGTNSATKDFLHLKIITCTCFLFYILTNE